MLWPIIVAPAPAQNYLDLVKLRYESTPPTNYEGVDEGQSQINEFFLDLTAPIELNDRYAIITGFIGESLSSQFKPDDPHITRVYATTLKVGLNVKYNNRFSVQYVLLPKIASDFIGGGNIQLGGVVLAKYARSNELKWKYGLYYNSELFGPFFVPLLGVYYHRAGSRWEFDLTLPLSANADYRLSDHWSAGAHFGTFVRTYNLNQSPFIENSGYLQKNGQELFLYGRWKPLRSLILEAGVGFTVGRRYEIYDDQDKVHWGILTLMVGDDRPEPENPNFRNGMIFSLRAVYRYPLNESPIPQNGASQPTGE